MLIKPNQISVVTLSDAFDIYFGVDLHIGIM